MQRLHARCSGKTPRSSSTGKYFDFPLRNVHAEADAQKPHPPLWVACSQLDTIQMARPVAAWAPWDSSSCRPTWLPRPGCNAYYNAFVHVAGQALPTTSTNANIALVSGFMCAETRTRRRCDKADGWTFFQFCPARLLRHPRRRRSRRARSTCGRSTWSCVRTDAAGAEGSAPRTSLVGSPETHAAQRLRKFQRVATSTRSSC